MNEEIMMTCEHKFSEWMIGKQCLQKYTYAFRVCKACGKTERVRLDCEHKNQERYAVGNHTWRKVCLDCMRILE